MTTNEDRYVAVPLDEPWLDDEGTVMEPRTHRTVSWRLTAGYLDENDDLGDVSMSMSPDAALRLAIAILEQVRDGGNEGGEIEIKFDQGSNQHLQDAVEGVRCSVSPDWDHVEPLTDEESAVVHARWIGKQ